MIVSWPFVFLVIYNPTMASIMSISFYWWGIVWDKGELLNVLPFSIVKQILLVTISSRESNLIRWDLPSDGLFIYRQFGSLSVVLGRGIRLFRLTNNDISYLIFLFFSGYCMVFWLLIMHCA